CSIQRRFQKLIEEAPSVVVDEEKRQEIGQRAVEMARLAEYVNAGTIEFLYDGQEFFFNEINARLQVEHPVTELVTGMDLVKQQLRIASGEELDISEKDVRFKGWAMECRVNAEDPYSNFMPSPGFVDRYEPPGSIGVRIDSGIVAGSEIPTFYDPLFAKIIVWARTRDVAVERMKRALGEWRIEGIKTNIPFHLKILEDESFKKGEIDTAFVQRKQIIEKLRKEGEDLRIEMMHKAAAISAALALSKEGITNYLQVDRVEETAQQKDNWKIAGRNEQLARRLNADEVRSDR
ncbi:MAG: hypothetical protein KAW09_06920, partial [Thermoplasmata archaeon]|nr:hypothetical protein [Thermoplasmata archaeon]